MGLGDTIKQLIMVKADTSQAKAEVRALRGEEKKAAQERLAEIDRHNKGIDDQLKMWTKVAGGIAGVTAAVLVARNAYKAFLEDQRLEAAAAGASIKDLQAATMGLVETDDLLAFAGKTMHGTWKLNQAEMEKVLHGAMAIRKNFGEELEPTIQKLTESIAKGNTKALREFGIEAKDKEGVLRELDSAWRRMGGGADLAGDDMKRAGTAIADSFDDMKGALGELVVELRPFISALADAMGWIAKGIAFLRTGKNEDAGKQKLIDETNAKIAEGLGQLPGVGQGYFSGRVVDLVAEQQQFTKVLQFQKDAKDAGEKIFESIYGAAAAGLSGAASTFQGSQGKKLKEEGFQLNAAEAEGFRVGDSEFGSLQEMNAYLNRPIDTELAPSPGAGEIFGGKDVEYRETIDAAKEALAGMADEFKRLDEIQKSMQRDRDFSQIFGTPEEFNVHAEAVNALADSFGILEAAGGAAYEALVTGSGSATEAMKKALANGLLAMGKEFFVRALGETAAGLAMLAFPDPLSKVSASQHFLAAAAYGAASVAAGVAANALGAGGGGGGGARPPVGGSRAGNSLGGGVGRGDVTRNVTVILGGGYDNMSERERAGRFARAVKRGMDADESTTIRDG